MSTIIVRDATLAINGAPESRGVPGEHMRMRVSEAATLESRRFQDFVDVLAASSLGDDSDPEVLEALLILGLSQPQLGSQLGISAASVGRRLAARLERLGESEQALAVLELLAEHHPGHRAIERDLGSLMRRQGMVQDLVERYQERAMSLLRVGKTAEAIEWYREILLLDRSRKDIARMIRDLRFQEVEDRREVKKRWRVSFSVLLISGLLSMLVLREVSVYQDFYALPSVQTGDLSSMRHRLASIEEFMKRYPVWHGSLKVLRERADLRAEVTRMQDAVEVDEVEAQELVTKQIEEATLARNRGIERADAGDLPGALKAFEEALQHAPSDWIHRERLEVDVEAIRDHLVEDNQ